MAYISPCVSNRLDPEPETFDLYDAYLLPDGERRRRVCVPQFPCVAHLPSFIEVLYGLCGLTHHDPLTRDDGPALRARTEECNREDHETTNRCDAGDQRQTDSHTRSLRVEQDDRADDKRDESAKSQRAKCGHVKFGDDHAHAEHDKRQPRIVHRQNLQGEQGEHQRYDADHARKHDAGIVAFEQEPVEADQQKPVGDRGMGNDRQQLGAPVRIDALDGETLCRKLYSSVADEHLTAVDLRQKVRYVARDKIDDMPFQRLARRQARGAAHGVVGPLHIAPAQLREAMQVRRGVVDHLAFHRRAGLRSMRIFDGGAGGPADRSGRGRGLLPPPRGHRGWGSPPTGAAGAGASSPPPMDTGVAAPTLVAGAMAAMWLAYRI